MEIKYFFIGRVSYREGVHMMEKNIPEAIQKEKIFWWGLEHDLVYTKGVSTSPKHILNKNIQTISSRRGGSITVHNPGQLVFYSVVPLALVKGGLDMYLRHLESSIIETLWDYKIYAFINPPYSGVWTRKGKIAFVGLAMRSGVIYHGIAVNLINSLKDYDPIHSCGIELPVCRLLDLHTIYGQKINLKPENILNEFSDKLYSNLHKRFSKMSPLNFKQMIQKKKEEFPQTHLSFNIGKLYFNERLYWEAHESWEIFWHSHPPNCTFKKFLQGLIQLSSACYKLTYKWNPKGALSLFKKSHEKLIENYYLDEYIKPLEDQVHLIDYIKENINRLEQLFSTQDKIMYSIENRKKLFTPYILCTKIDYQNEKNFAVQ